MSASPVRRFLQRREQVLGGRFFVSRDPRLAAEDVLREHGAQAETWIAQFTYWFRKTGGK